MKFFINVNLSGVNDGIKILLINHKYLSVIEKIIESWVKKI
jgi:hypothetical protein